MHSISRTSKIIYTFLGSLIVGAITASLFLAWSTPEGFHEPREVSWEVAIVSLNNGEVKQVAQYHSLEVELMLKNKRILTTTEPVIDAIFYEIEKCGVVCEDIVLVTE